MTDKEAEQLAELAQSYGDADDVTKEKVFDFFGLPPELRNTVYSLLVEDKHPNIIERGNDAEYDDICFVKDQMLAKCL